MTVNSAPEVARCSASPVVYGPIPVGSGSKLIPTTRIRFPLAMALGMGAGSTTRRSSCRLAPEWLTQALASDASQGTGRLHSVGCYSDRHACGRTKRRHPAGGTLDLGSIHPGSICPDR